MRDPLHCLLVTGIFPPDVGGPARFIPGLALQLRENRIRCSVVTLSDELSHADSFPFPVHRIRRRRNYGIRMAATIREILRRCRDADVLFANGLHFEAAVAASIARKPLVTKFVGDEIWERANLRGWYRDDVMSFQSFRDWKVEPFRLMRGYALRVSKRIVVPSRFTRELVENWAKLPLTLDIVPNAVETQPDVAPLSLPFRHDTFRILAASRLIPLKRIDGLIRTVARIPKISLVLVGDGPEEHRLRRLAADLAVSERIAFMGPLSHGDTLSAMKAADLFVLNSTVENFPHVILEAMMIGLPVLATRVGGIPEIVTSEHNGLLVDPNDADLLAEGITRLMRDGNLREKLVANGRETAGRFSWRRLGDRMADILTAVGDSRR